MRVLSAAGRALINRIKAGEQVGWVQLVQMDLTAPLRLVTAGRDMQWAGETWHTAGVGVIDPIEDGTGELQGLSFTMPGVDQTQLALVLSEPVEGKPVRVWDALVNPDNGQIEEAVLAWFGTLNVPSIADGPEAVVTVTAEHYGVQAVRPKARRYTNEWQQRLYPGDTSLNFDPATDAAPLAWPKASYFKR